MCTVSFYKDKEKVIITSNRDESLERPLAVFPMVETINDAALYFPKDPKAGGTWFVANGNGSIFVLLNGAENKHVSTPPYRLSRGIVLLQLAAAVDLELEWNLIDLDQIEPFTIIAYVNSDLIQFRWNGCTKNWNYIFDTTYKIWSSSTLYSSEIISLREKWFFNFLRNKKHQLEASDLLDFHSNTHLEDQENGIIINRFGGSMLTKNVTQFILKDKQFSVLHKDLIQDSSDIISIKLK